MRRNSIIFILILVITMSFGCSKEQNAQIPDESNSSGVINLYFSGENAQYLLPEERKISPLTIKEAFEQLVLGPNNNDLHSTLPPNVKLLDVHIENRIAVLNINKELYIAMNGNYGTSTASYMLINSLVGTFVYNEVFQVDGIKLLIEGKDNVSLGQYGVLDIIYPNEGAFKQEEE